MENKAIHTLKIGTVFDDKYVILEFIAIGGMGEVYRAHQINLKRDVGIKIISREWLESLEENKEELEIGLQRFRNEVQTMAQVRHPNVLQIYDYGSSLAKKGNENLPVEYIVMEYVPGGTLRSTMSEDGFYPEEDLIKEWLLKYFLPVLDGVQALHDVNIIHRDLKPGNVLMDGKTPRIADFGLARSYQITPVTQSIEIKGTPAYMSPEQFYDLRRTDQRADVYSLGKILFEAISGRITSKTIPFKQAKLPNPEMPFFKRLDQIIQEATVDDRNERFDSVKEFRNAVLAAIESTLEKSTADVSMSTSRLSVFSGQKWIWTGIVVAIVSVLLMTLWHLLGEPGKSTLVSKEPPAAGPTMKQSKKPIASDAVIPVPTSPEQTLTGKDGATLHLVPGGELVLPEKFGSGAGKTIQVDPFYLDETEVTNHQYVGFLNRVISEIQVEGSVVRGDRGVWLMLGEVERKYEPIVFQQSKFFVNNPAFHSHPVVRVTPYGASAYARFYGRRLPTEIEWLRAVTGSKKMQRDTTGIGSESSTMMTHMEMMNEQTKSSPSEPQQPSKSPVSVTQFKPNLYRIRGLRENVSEWVLSKGSRELDKQEKLKYLILPSAVIRQPWEAFEEVGFRTALSIGPQVGQGK